MTEKHMTYPDTIDLTTEMLMGHLASVAKKGREAVSDVLKEALLAAYAAGVANGEAAHGYVSRTKENR